MGIEDFKSPLPPRRVNWTEDGPGMVEEKVVDQPEMVTENSVPAPDSTPTPEVKNENGKRKWWVVATIVAIVAVTMIILAVRILGAKKEVVVTTINYWGLWEEESVVNGVIADFEVKNPKIKVNYIKNQPINYRTRLQAKLAKGEADSPDIFRIHNSWLPMMKDNLAKVPAETAKKIGLETDFFDVYKRDLRINGSYVAVPLMYDGLSMFYNPEILNSAGVKPPKSWWGLQEAAKKLTERDDNGTIRRAGVALGVTDNVDHWSDILGLMLKQNGADLIRGTDEDWEKAKAILTYTTNFKLDYRTWDESLEQSTMAFARGKLAFYFAPSWRAFEIEAINPDLKYEVTTVPQLPTLSNAEYDKIESEGMTDYLTNIHWASYWAEGVNNKSGNSEAVWKFVEFLTSRESLEKMYAGASQVRSFGEIYPRKSMAESLSGNAKIKAWPKAADNASGWYLSSETHDDGLNEEMRGYFADAINGMVYKNIEAEKAVETLKNAMVQMMGKYQLQVSR